MISSKTTVIGPPGPVAAPAAPTLTQQGAGGTLGAGTYTYQIGATAPGGESPGPTAQIVIAAGATNQVTVTSLGAAPAGATGYRLYGRVAGAPGLLVAGVSYADSYVDGGGGVGVAPTLTNTTAAAAPGVDTEKAADPRATAMPSTTRAPEAVPVAGATRQQISVT